MQDTVNAYSQLGLPSLSYSAPDGRKHAVHNPAPHGAAVHLPPSCFANSALAAVSPRFLPRNDEP